MKSLVKFFLLAGALAYFVQDSETKPQADLDTLIGEVFGTGSGNNNNDNKQPPLADDRSKPQAVRGSSNTNQLDCECVPYYLCNNNTIITDGVGLIDIRSGFLSSNVPCSCAATNAPGIKEGPCENYLEVCCKLPNKLIDPITPEPIVRTGCGRRNAEGIGFRIKGDEDNEAQFGEFPWMVAILKEETVDKTHKTLNVYHCGGALIHSQVVLTAAHCVAPLKNPHSLKVRAGEWDTQTKNELFPHQDRYVKSIVVHPEFYAGALHNDIALLFLKNPVDIAENVDIICLPAQGALYDHSRCFTSGWGKDTFGNEGRYQVILKKVELPVVPQQACVNSLHKTRLGPYFELHKSFICAGGEAGKDACKGDGGSPLACPRADDPNIYDQVGIVAWGIGCGENETPGVYANVPLFRDWIDDQIADAGLSQP